LLPTAHIIGRRVACYVVHSVLLRNILADFGGVFVVMADDDDELGLIIRRLVVYERLWDDGWGWVRVCEGRSWFPDVQRFDFFYFIYTTDRQSKRLGGWKK
jgi:hypothetical protein